MADEDKPEGPIAEKADTEKWDAGLAAAFGPDPTAPLAGAPEPGTVIGRYKLLQNIGVGGFGLVYMAEQQEPIRRRVALKIIKLGMDTAQVIGRFEAERQALAMMDHPNIARVLDAGTTDTGRPYFVMELVRGIPITEYCDKNRLAPKQRLELFVSVCHAVQHAHQKGIIHRDIKPSNVMVTLNDGEPVPKVIDFGVAKATQARLTEKTIFTQYGQFIGTPAYMSPEQAEMSGLDVDTRSDIYSLGVLLYELLTGSTPIDQQRLRTVGYAEIQRMIREEEPLTPSSRLSHSGETITSISAQRNTEPKKLGQLLRGDLDWIVMKALEKDRTRRYETADGFAADVVRYLHDEPVEASPPSVAYRVRKFMRRHKALLITVSSFAAILVMATVVSLLFAVRAWHAEAAARYNEGLAKQESKAAESAKRTAQLSEKRARRQLYVADMNLAAQAWHAANPRRARDLLERYRSEPELRELRQFEWYCLWQLTGGGPISLLHATPVYEVSFTPSGREVITNRTAEPGALLPSDMARVWDLATGRELRIPLRSQEAIELWQLSPDGRIVAAWERDGQIRIRNVESAESIRLLASISTPITSLQFSPDARTLAACTTDSTIAFWDLVSGTVRTTEKLPEDEPLVVTFSPDGKTLATRPSSFSSTWLQLHDVSTGQRLQELTVSPCYLSSVAFSPDGKTLAVGERDSHLVTLFDVATGEKRMSLSGHTDGLHAVKFSPDGELLASSSSDLTVRLWDVHSGALRHTLRGHRAWTWPIAFSADGRILASGGMDNTVALWDAKTGKQIGEPLIGHSNTVWSLAFSPSGRELASASADGSVRLWNVSFDPIANLLRGHTDSVSSLAVSKNGLLATASRDGTVRRWNMETREPIGEPLVGHKQSANHMIGVALSPDGALLALAAPNGIKLWQADTGDLCYHLDRRPSRSVAFSPDGMILATGSDEGDHTIALRDAKTGDIRKVLRGHRGTVRALAFSPDGLWLASSGMDPRIILWNVKTGETKGEPLGGHQESVRSLTFSPDGTILASAGDATARLWNVEAGNPLAVFEGHANWVFSVAFSPDGKTLASGSTDGTVKLWDVELHEQRATFASARGAGVLSVVFSADGKTLVAGDDNGTVKLWHTKDPGREH